MLEVSGLPPTPDDKEYEVWWIGEKQGPLKAGIFEPLSHGATIVSLDLPPPGEVVLASAITLEPTRRRREAERRDVPEGRFSAPLAKSRARNPIRRRARISGMDPNETAFDLDRYLRVCGATKPECFDWNDAATASSATTRCSRIAYMMDIESHTIVVSARPAVDARRSRQRSHRIPVVLGLRGIFSLAAAPPLSRDAGSCDRRSALSPICAAEPVSPIASSVPASQSCRA